MTENENENDRFFNKHSIVHLNKLMLDITPDGQTPTLKDSNGLTSDGIEWNARKMTLIDENFCHMLFPSYSIFNKKYANYDDLKNDIISVGASLSSSPSDSIEDSKIKILKRMIAIKQKDSEGDRKFSKVSSHENNVATNLEEINEVCKKFGVIFHSDMAQALHGEKFDLAKKYSDFLSELLGTWSKIFNIYFVEYSSTSMN